MNRRELVTYLRENQMLLGGANKRQERIRRLAQDPTLLGIAERVQDFGAVEIANHHVHQVHLGENLYLTRMHSPGNNHRANKALKEAGEFLYEHFEAKPILLRATEKKVQPVSVIYE